MVCGWGQWWEGLSGEGVGWGRAVGVRLGCEGWGGGGDGQWGIGLGGEGVGQGLGGER